MTHIMKKVGIFVLTLMMGVGIYHFNNINVQAQNGVEEGKLNFLVVESAYIEPSDSQRIVVNMGQDGRSITEAQLSYTSPLGMVSALNASQIDGNTILFELKVAKDAAVGEYKLTEVSYITDSGEMMVRLKDAGIQASFGVGVELAVDADAYVVDEDLEVGTNIVSLDEEGEQLSSVSIAEALTNSLGDQKDNTVQTKSFASDGKYVVVLDPGHGGNDSGATRTHNGVTYYERNIVLKIAEYCKAELEKNRNIEVYLTRTDNSSTLMDRRQRTDFAISKGADVIVSLHINATDTKTTSASGSLVFCPKDDTVSGELSQNLADRILSELGKLGLKNRGKVANEKSEGYGMIKYPKEYGVPGILVEHAFINNANDVSNFLSTDEKLKKLGIADAQGILEYLNKDDLNYYADVFDAEYYAEKYSDVFAVLGNNKIQLLHHFINYGMQEGRQGCGSFDVFSYRNQYADLRRSYGDDLELYYRHYMNYGKQEGRQGAGCNILWNALTVYFGMDYSKVYDYNYYIAEYADVKQLLDGDETAVLQHFVRYGIQEGRQGNTDFNVYNYRTRYIDLQNVFDDDLAQYYTHYIQYGINEGRNGK